MPKIPRWMANAMESLFSGSYHPVTVTETQYLSDTLKRVRMVGNFSAGKKVFSPGNVIEFRVNETEFRHYTPSYFNHTEGICEVLFYLHDKGPGSRWADRLKQGDRLKMIGPAGRMSYDTEAEAHILYGDETSLGLSQCISEEAARHGNYCFCIAELKEEHQQWPSMINLKAASVNPHPVSPAFNACTQMETVLKNYPGNKSKISFYLTGNAKAIQVFRKNLLGLGFQGAQIHSDPYWVEGKCGL